jgi:hypothetical protein
MNFLNNRNLVEMSRSDVPPRMNMNVPIIKVTSAKIDLQIFGGCFEVKSEKFFISASIYIYEKSI